jgi:succinate dehydrogenase/fumarate reductase flavoprotein subunit
MLVCPMVDPSPVAFDLVVIGAGTAGIACAIAAVEGGARVLLIEKDPQIGGTLHVSGGHMSAAGTRRQAARGIVDSPEDHLADIRRISRGTGRDDIITKDVMHAGETVDWLEDHGFAFASESPVIIYGHEPYTIARTHYGVNEGLSILEVYRRVLDGFAGNELFTLWTNSPVVDLGQDADGRISRVTALRRGIDEVTVAAGAVVLATGGFAANAELFQELEGAPLVSAARVTSTGDGIYLARAIGAGIQGRGKYIPTFGGLPDARAPGRANWDDRQLLTSERPPLEIYVNERGQRWVAEDDPSIDSKERALATIPRQTFWTIFDDVMLEQSVGRKSMIVGKEPTDIREMANSRRGVHSASTIAELAELAGINRLGLSNTVHEYNTAVAVGIDPDFGRKHLPLPITTPPFYAIRNHGIALITFAGLDIDSDFRVRDEEGNSIPGLYAIGEIIGAAATSGNSFCSGMAVTPSITFGRLLGKEIAAGLSPRT